MSLDAIVAAAMHAPSADNSQPWHLFWDGDRLDVCYDTARVAGKTFGRLEHANLLTIGALFENVAQVCDALGVPAAPQWYLDDSHTDRYLTLPLSASSADVDTHALALFSRHTNRLPFLSKAIDRTALDAIGNMREGSARVVVLNDAEQRAEVYALAKSASEARFQTKELHEWLSVSLRFGREADSGDGLDVATLDLPPLGSHFMKFTQDWGRMQFLNRLGAYKIMAHIDAQPLRRGPSVVALVAEATPMATVDAGRLMERAWIALNEFGIAAHPNYVIPDALNRLKHGRVPTHLAEGVQGMAARVPSCFGLEDGEALHILFRAGYPKRTHVPSRRVAKETVFTDRS